MKRILFVDDEPFVLQALERMLRSMRYEWEMSFASSGADALTRLAQASHDVLVTDLMLPGMNGLELMEAARERSPQTVRIVLSGQVNQRLAVRCVGLAHQYVAKPCDAECLVRTITSVTDLGYLLQCEKLLALVSQLRGLPSLPAVHAQVMRLLDDPNASPVQIGAVIAKDVSLTAGILKTVNSAFFGLAHRVLEPAEAVAFLGMNTLRSVLVASSVFDQLASNVGTRYSASAAVSHGRKVAAAARLIAHTEHAPRAMVDGCFTAGLLHDIGKLVLAACLPESFHRIAPQPVTLDDERATFGATHAEVGAYLLGLWGLPDAAVEAARLHHSPADSPSRKFLPLTAAHVANCLVPRVGAEGAAPSAPLDEAYLAELGLSERLPIWRAAVQQLHAAPTPASATP